MKKKTKSTSDKDDFLKKIERLYQNYGMDTSSMDEEEFIRLKSLYQKRGQDIDQDLASSEKYKDRFADDLV